MQVIHARALYDSDSQVYDIDTPLYPGYVDWFEAKITLKLNYPSQNLHY